MEDSKERTEGRSKIMNYIRLIFVTAMGLVLLITVGAAIYRNF